MRRYLLAAIITFGGGALAHAQTLDQQERCALQAKRVLHEGGTLWQTGEYQSHYSNETGKCFALLVNKITDRRGIIDAIFLVDPVEVDPDERHPYAIYMQVTLPGRSDIVQCDLIPRFREMTHCNSREEFDAFVARYLEE
jgi:hypothetical protein